MKNKQVRNILFTVVITLLVAFVAFALLLRPRTLDIGQVDSSTPWRT